MIPDIILATISATRIIKILVEILGEYLHLIQRRVWAERDFVKNMPGNQYDNSLTNRIYIYKCVYDSTFLYK